MAVELILGVSLNEYEPDGLEQIIEITVQIFTSPACHNNGHYLDLEYVVIEPNVTLRLIASTFRRVRITWIDFSPLNLPLVSLGFPH
jgi:hypothetical protein